MAVGWAATSVCLWGVTAAAGFYKGLYVQIIKGMPNAMIQFVAYDAMKALLQI